MDFFSQMVEAGHGVRVHTEDKPYVCPPAPVVRMITYIELFDDFWSQMIERPEEELAPLEAGPWADQSYDEYGDETYVGFEPMAETEEILPSYWDTIYSGHREEQRTLGGIEKAFDKSIQIQMRQDLKEQRDARYNLIYKWIEFCDNKDLIRRAMSKLWKKVLKSRQVCGESGKWEYVWLTKDQVNNLYDLVKDKK